MKTLLAIGLTVTGLLFVAGCGTEKKPETTGQKDQPAVLTAPAKPTEGGGNQTFCSVMWGNPIDKSIYADSNGKRVYFCCNFCQTKFKENPEMYIKKLEDAGVTLEKAPATTSATAR